MVLRAMIDFDQTGAGVGGGVSLMNPVEHFSSRFRSRLHNKGGMSLLQPPSPNPSEYISSSSPRSTYGIGELNRRITDLKVDHPAISPPHNFMRDSSPKLLELGQNYPPNNPSHYQPTATTLQYNQQLGQIRRDSNNSTTSSSYYSMKSCDVSRRSSNQSHTSSVSTIRPNANFANYDPNYFYDPISAGSSRRSSQLSTADNNNYGPPSSQLLSSHLARLQRHSTTSSSAAMPASHQQYNAGAAFYQQHPHHPYSYNPYINQGNVGGGAMQQHQHHMFYNYPMPSSQNFHSTAAGATSHMYNDLGSQMPTSSTDRRMSEPISNASRNVQNDFPRSIQRPRSTTPTKSLEMLLEPKKEPQGHPQKPKREKACEDKGSPSKPHPNETVVLDVLKTNEKIENCDELVIPDDMVQFITIHEGTKPKIKLDLDEIEPMASSISIEKIKEEDLLTLLAEVDGDAKASDTQDEVKNDNDEAAANPINDFNNNGDDDCKIESDTSNAHQQITCKS